MTENITVIETSCIVRVVANVDAQFHLHSRIASFADYSWRNGQVIEHISSLRISRDKNQERATTILVLRIAPWSLGISFYGH
jgi:hypothetical protein